MKNKCPICQNQTVHKYRPFCSDRCVEIDLGKWVMGSYAIPAEEEPLPEIINLQKDET